MAEVYQLRVEKAIYGDTRILLIIELKTFFFMTVHVYTQPILSGRSWMILNGRFSVINRAQIYRLSISF